MIATLRRILDWVRRPWVKYAPQLEEGTVCCAYECSRPATDQWRPSVCALNEADIEPKWMPVCAECDVFLNETLTRFFHQGTYDAELAAYKQRRLSNGDDTKHD